MSGPRILHLHFGTDGGAERFFVALAQGLGRRGAEQRFVIRPNRRWRPELEPWGAITENHFRRLSLSGWLLKGRVRRICRDWRPDAILAWMPRAARLVPDLDGPLKLCRIGDFPKHLRHFRHCDMIVGINPQMEPHVRGLGWTKPYVNIANFARPVTPRPVDRAALGTPQDAFLVAGGGRFVPRKGLDVLVRAVARVEGAHLWLVGDGRERANLEALVDELGLRGRTRFTGWVEEAIHHFAAADALVMPSRHEPLGNTVFEAWRAGAALVSTRSEGPSWSVRDGVDGILCDIDDVEGIARALTALRDDPGLRRRLVAGGEEALATRFSEEAVVQQYLALVRDPAGVLAAQGG